MLVDVIVYALKPFYLAGEGQALCAVCLCRVQKNSDITVPAFFSRSEFIHHYRQEHWDHSVTSGRHVPTLCLGSAPVAENPQGQAIQGFDIFDGLGTCDILKHLIPSRPSSGLATVAVQAPAPAPQPSAAGPSDAVNNIASSEEILELVDICKELSRHMKTTGNRMIPAYRARPSPAR